MRNCYIFEEGFPNLVANCKCLAHLVNSWVVHLNQVAANSLARLDILARALARVLVSRTMRTIVTKRKRMWIMVTITIIIFILVSLIKYAALINFCSSVLCYVDDDVLKTFLHFLN